MNAPSTSTLPALLLLLAPAAPAQDPPVFELDCPGHGAAVLGRVQAVLDPWGELVVTGVDAEGARHDLRLLFPHELRLPRTGNHQVSAREDAIRVYACGSRPLRGVVEIERFDWQRVRLSGRLSSGEQAADRVELDVDVEPRPAVAKVVDGREPPDFEPPADVPRDEDLVFCALGGQGTGWPGQHRVATAVGELMDTGPLDFVLLLGDNVLPRGVTGLGDDGFQRAFEQVYHESEFSVTPFYLVLGRRDGLGSVQALLDYGRNVDRWKLPAANYSFRRTSHGETFTFVAIDAELYTGDVIRPEVRMTTRIVNRLLEEAEGSWKVVFAHQPMYGHGRGVPKMDRAGRRRLEDVLSRNGVDLYVAGGEHHLELLEEKAGVAHVISGGGGGPEVSRPVRWSEDTVFAHTGGGFTWFRYDGEALEVSFRDVEGDVLYAHRLVAGEER